MRRFARSLSFCATALAALPGQATALQSSSGGEEAGQWPRQLPTLRRMVRHFDFEEARLAPFDMPINFYRYGGHDGAAAQGFPPFGEMKLSDASSNSGEWSFEFQLDGGSLAARIPTAVIPAVPLADYAVTTRVRTAGLTRARARLVAWLHNKQGEKIHDSEAASELIDTQGQWQTLTVDVRGDYEDAADLVLELQLLQPRQFVSAEHADRPTALLEDIGGRAWFDDVTVWHVPRVEISTTHSGNVVPPGQTPSLTMLVRDLAHEHLAARLRVYDIDGRLVHDEQFPAPRMPRPRTVDLPLDRRGWYRAVLEVSSEGELIARQWLDFLLLAPLRNATSLQNSQFAIILPQHWEQHVDEHLKLLRRIGSGMVSAPLWTEKSRPRGTDLAHEAYSRLVGDAHRRGVALNVILAQVPEQLARMLDISSDNVLAAVASDVSNWREYIDRYISISAEVNHWQIGESSHSGAYEQNNLQSMLDAAERSVDALGPQPALAIPVAFDRPVEDELEVASRIIYIPNTVQPDAIAAYAEHWQRHPSPVTAVLEQLSPEHAQRLRLEHAMLCGLHAWRAGLSHVAIDAPWDDGKLQPVMPDATFAAWRQLADRLHGRQWAGELGVLSEGTCWILQGEEPGDDALVAWGASVGSASAIQMQLADHDVRTFDVFGNEQVVPLRGGEHTIPLTGTPVFVEGINLPLVQFRGGFALEPSFISAEHRTHHHELVIRNPWDMPLTGSIHVRDKPGWRLTPRMQEFTIGPLGEARLPVEIVFDRSIASGEDTLSATVQLQADGNYRLDLSTPIRIGLPYMDFSVAWQRVPNADTGQTDLFVTQYITNTGSEPVYADAFLVAPEISQQRRLIAGLEPGDMAVRVYRIANGASLLAGRSLRLSLADRNGVGRLNRQINIPAYVDEQVAEVPLD